MPQNVGDETAVQAGQPAARAQHSVEVRQIPAAAPSCIPQAITQVPFARSCGFRPLSFKACPWLAPGAQFCAMHSSWRSGAGEAACVLRTTRLHQTNTNAPRFYCCADPAQPDWAPASGAAHPAPAVPLVRAAGV